MPTFHTQCKDTQYRDNYVGNTGLCVQTDSWQRNECCCEIEMVRDPPVEYVYSHRPRKCEAPTLLPE